MVGAFSVISNLRMELFEALVCGAKYDILYHGWAETRDRPDYPSDILHLICRIGPADREVLGHGDKYKCRFNVEQNIFLCNPTFYLP